MARRRVLRQRLRRRLMQLPFVLPRAAAVAQPRCRTCLGTGHWSAECPLVRQAAVCYVCGEAGHRGRDCPTAEALGMFCEHCGIAGHFTEDCYNAPGGLGGGGGPAFATAEMLGVDEATMRLLTEMQVGLLLKTGMRPNAGLGLAARARSCFHTRAEQRLIGVALSASSAISPPTITIYWGN